MKNLKTFLVIALASFSCLAVAVPALAATAGNPCSPQNAVSGSLICGSCDSKGNNCVWTVTAVQPSPDCNDPSASGLQQCLKHNKIIVDLNYIIDFLSAGVGLVVVGSLILGGIQYTMAGGNPDAVGKAKHRITNALLALVVFIFIFAFLQWIIPGGL
ncbi:MAG TPA: hypothetical protein VFK97_00600 [Candidatus Saccharimonadales bacterium]|nr:hypothetical protein [Candidatus Saccharimonadales bacterium]